MLRRDLGKISVAIGALISIALLVTTVAAFAPKGDTRPVQVVAQVAPTPNERTILDEWARRDLSELPKKLYWRPLLPSSLPSGFAYVRVTTGEQPHGTIRAFDIFVAGPDPSMGRSAIHVHQGVPTPGITGIKGKSNPLDVYRNVVQPITLPNGTWQVMQQDHNPGKGAWIFMAQRGELFIEVDGLVSKETLQGFVASLR